MANRATWHPAEQHHSYWRNSCFSGELDADLATQSLHSLIFAGFLFLLIRPSYSTVLDARQLRDFAYFHVMGDQASHLALLRATLRTLTHSVIRSVKDSSKQKEK